MKDVNVAEGYKSTDIGVIPEDWNANKLGDIAIISSGGTPSRSNPSYCNGDIPWITTTQINFNTIFSSEEFITKLGLNNSSAKLYDKNTLLMAMYGQGKTRGKVAILGIKATINQACASIQINRNNSNQYIFFYLSHQYEQIRKLSNTGNQENLNGNLIKTISIPLPPLPEQKAIARVLSDVDDLIRECDSLLAKKRDIKQGTMQQLLTGKKRLPGFSGEWEKKRLGDYIVEFKGGAPLTPSDFTENGVKVLPKGGVIQGGILKIEKDKLQYCSIHYAEKHKSNLIDRSYTIVVLRDLVPSGPAIGLIVKINTNDVFILAQGVYGFKVNEEYIDISFLIQYSNGLEYRQIMKNIMVGSTQVHITNTDFKNLQIVFPPTLPEQRAIAQILSDMDAEIEGLEKKRDKYKAIKQGMMQELLTGKTRLINN